MAISAEKGKKIISLKKRKKHLKNREKGEDASMVDKKKIRAEALKGIRVSLDQKHRPPEVKKQGGGT